MKVTSKKVKVTSKKVKVTSKIYQSLATVHVKNLIKMFANLYFSDFELAVEKCLHSNTHNTDLAVSGHLGHPHLECMLRTFPSC